MRVDLHLHTTASDGRLTPSQLVKTAGEKGLKVIAITDHDSTEGLAEALEAGKAFNGMKIIPGIEVSTDIPDNEVHLLGYFINYKNPAVQENLAKARDVRGDRGLRMVKKLEALGMPIKWERVRELAQGAVGRPHIAQAMVEKGYVASIQEAFDKYIGRTGPAYAERRKMTPAEAVSAIVEWGGLPVLAHPAELRPVLDELLDELQAAGLVGMEVHYQRYPPDLVAFLKAAAKKRGLIPCGGSDYHGLGNPQEVDIGEADVPVGSAQRLIALAEKRRGKPLF